jgi:hypothetical protein
MQESRLFFISALSSFYRYSDNLINSDLQGDTVAWISEKYELWNIGM